MCQVLDVHRSSYYAWKKAKPKRLARRSADETLGRQIREVFDEEKGLYGAKRIAAELSERDDSNPVNHKRVARVMKKLGLYGFSKKRRVKTTVSASSRRVFPDLVKRRFRADETNRLLVGDITYLPIQGGTNLYLATVIDCYSRRLVGFSIADHMRSELVIDALEEALRQRGSLVGAIFHSDHGSVYTSKEFQQSCRDLGVIQSMGAVGTSADNALAESFNATLKREVLRNRRCFASVDQARRQVFAWCVRYNTKRRHSWCKYMSPIQFEAATCAILNAVA